MAAGTTTTTGSASSWSPGISADGDLTISGEFGSTDQVTSTVLCQKLRLDVQYGRGSDLFWSFFCFVFCALLFWGSYEIYNDQNADDQVAGSVTMAIFAILILGAAIGLLASYDESCQKAKERNQRALEPFGTPSTTVTGTMSCTSPASPADVFPSIAWPNCSRSAP
ncbi:hypothetical protein RB200_34590 [Streptomyces sp. PmtG]